MNCLTTLEREIEEREKTKTQQLNEICMVSYFDDKTSRDHKSNSCFQLSAQITELTDRVEKARLRENELTERVGRWVEYLREEKEKVTVTKLQKKKVVPAVQVAKFEGIAAAPLILWRYSRFKILKSPWSTRNQITRRKSVNVYSLLLIKTYRFG